MSAEPVPLSSSTLPDTVTPGDRRLDADAARVASTRRRGAHLRLVSSDGGQADLSAEVAAAIDHLVTALAAGRQVSVLPVDTLITTSQAAEILGISRPTLVRLLEIGEIAYAKPGKHRRLKLSDVLSYRKVQQRRSAELHQAMADEADVLGAYDWTAEDYRNLYGSHRRHRYEQGRSGD